MYSPIFNQLMQYGGAVLLGVVTGLICKAYFAAHFHKKIHEYEVDILNSHAKILELEARNEKLEKKVKENQKVFTKDFIFMN